MANSLTNSQQAKPKFSVAIQSDAYQKLINNTLGDKVVAQKFIADISSVVSNNYKLAQCDAGSILASGLMAQSLDLPLHQGLGFAYLVPYAGKAQFILGYKGYIQLAIRSRYYRSINALVVHEGEYLGRDQYTGEPRFNFAEDSEDKPVVGYMAAYEMINGARKAIYWSKSKMEKFGRRYSKAYDSFWGKDDDSFNNQALKTIIRQLISKWGIMSVEFQKAYESDMAVLDTEGNKSYVDNPENKEQITDENVNTENVEVVEEDIINNL